jgi:ankyrin repeat protein
MPQFAMTPLLAAVAHKRASASQALLARGADPNRGHLMFGTPIHTAAGGGDPETLELLIEHGGDVNVRNSQGQTALQVIAASRGMRDKFAQAQAMMKSLGHAMPGLLDQLANVALPTEGWDRCEELLKAHGAR